MTVDSAALTGVDAGTRTITRAVALRMQPSAVAFGYDAVWVADGRRGEVVRVAPGYDQGLGADPVPRAPGGAAAPPRPQRWRPAPAACG